MPLSLRAKQFMQFGADPIITKCCLLNQTDAGGERCHVSFSQHAAVAGESRLRDFALPALASLTLYPDSDSNSYIQLTLYTAIDLNIIPLNINMQTFSPALALSQPY